jgi:hypothetical protein
MKKKAAYVPTYEPKYKPIEWWEDRDPRVVDGLWQAVLADDLDKVDQMIARGAEINRSFIAGKTALICAAENGHEAIVRYLLLRGGCKTDLRDAVSDTMARYVCLWAHTHTLCWIVCVFAAWRNRIDESVNHGLRRYSGLAAQRCREKAAAVPHRRRPGN